MVMFKEFESRNNKSFEKVQLTYSSFFWISGNHKWFCRIWRKDWWTHAFIHLAFAESYGRTKFEAYRLAVKNIKW